MNSLNILHLSDLHIGNFKYENPVTLAINIANTLSDSGRKVDVVVVSGDIYDGQSKTPLYDLENALIFFRGLIRQLNLKEISTAILSENDVIFVPGNHDLVRSDGDQYEKYNKFIKEFYNGSLPPRLTLVDRYNFIYNHAEKRIAILGFNSCRISSEKGNVAELSWMDKVNLSDFTEDRSKILEKLREYHVSKEKWDDFGYIDPEEMDNVFLKLKREIPDYADYNLVAVFHHHFYPFPEIVNNHPDASFIRNYTAVLDQFQRHKVKLVLHGHKHLSIQRAITDNKFFEDPDSVIYVLSAGSIGHKAVYNPSFQWLRMFDKSHVKLADVERYDFKDEELASTKSFSIPPKARDERTMSVNLIETLQSEDPTMFIRYKTITENFEQVIQDSKISKIIDLISGIFTIFEDIKLELRKSPRINFLVLLSLNYRVIFLKNKYNHEQELDSLLSNLEREIKFLLNGSSYGVNLISFLSSHTNLELDKNYTTIMKNVLSSDKRISAYCSIVLFISDLFLNISEYGEYYFEKEKLTHKINIQLPEKSFYRSIPSDSISIDGDIDRRAIIFNFKSKDPTVHKVAVLIVKDFEMRLDKFEDSLKEIKLKLYYIIPKVRAENYDLENFHFDAYIPKLLPLLTGDNLYKSKEVFIRELVQNSIDATLLRAKMFPADSIPMEIKIVLGVENRNGQPTKFFRIVDNGTGMSRFTIERYFTSIGRSYYVSDEFDDLKKDRAIQFEAISNFGIGFLSSFMVSREVMVKTKSVSPDEQYSGLEIEIPNYDGCFFIRKIDINTFGTEITLYEDERKLFNFTKFTEYIKKNLLGLPLKIDLVNESDKRKNTKVESFTIQKNLLRLAQSTDLVFFIPFSENLKSISTITYNDFISKRFSELDTFGIWFNFSKIQVERTRQLKGAVTCLNQGLNISFAFLPFEIKNENFLPQMTVNYPSSFIQLDVAREKVVNLKDDVNLSGILEQLHDQVYEFFRSDHTKLRSLKLSELYIIHSVLMIEFGINCEKTIMKELYTLKFKKLLDGIEISVCQMKNIPKSYNSDEEFYYENSSLGANHSATAFFASISASIGSIGEHKPKSLEKIRHIVSKGKFNMAIDFLAHPNSHREKHMFHLESEIMDNREIFRIDPSTRYWYSENLRPEFYGISNGPITETDKKHFRLILAFLYSDFSRGRITNGPKDNLRQIYQWMTAAKAMILGSILHGEAKQFRINVLFSDFDLNNSIKDLGAT